MGISCKCYLKPIHWHVVSHLSYGYPSVTSIASYSFCWTSSVSWSRSFAVVACCNPQHQHNGINYRRCSWLILHSNVSLPWVQYMRGGENNPALGILYIWSWVGWYPYMAMAYSTNAEVIHVWQCVDKLGVFHLEASSIYCPQPQQQQGHPKSCKTLQNPLPTHKHSLLQPQTERTYSNLPVITGISHTSAHHLQKSLWMLIGTWQTHTIYVVHIYIYVYAWLYNYICICAHVYIYMYIIDVIYSIHHEKVKML